MTVRVPREYILGEIRYAIYIAQKYFPGKRFETEFVLGVHPLLLKYPPELEELIKEFRGAYAIADICIWTYPKPVIVEAKLKPAKFIEGWAKLSLYKDLIRITPRFIEAGVAEVDFVLATPVENPLVARKCWEEGFKNIIDCPDWYSEALRKYRPTYKAVPEFQTRLEKLKAGLLQYPSMLKKTSSQFGAGGGGT